MPCAGTGALVLGTIVLCSDVLGCIGSGTGILLAVTSTYQMYESIMKDPEMAKSIMPGMMNMMMS